MHPAIIIGIVRSLIVDVAMGQIPRSTERISSYLYYQNILIRVTLLGTFTQLYLQRKQSRIQGDERRDCLLSFDTMKIF